MTATAVSGRHRPESWARTVLPWWRIVARCRSSVSPKPSNVKSVRIVAHAVLSNGGLIVERAVNLPLSGADSAVPATMACWTICSWTDGIARPSITRIAARQAAMRFCHGRSA